MNRGKTSPDYYKLADGTESVDVIRCLIDHNGLDGIEGFLYGNLLKYLVRYKGKNGLEDLKKARVYLDWLIETEAE